MYRTTSVLLSVLIVNILVDSLPSPKENNVNFLRYGLKRLLRQAELMKSDTGALPQTDLHSNMPAEKSDDKHASSTNTAQIVRYGIKIFLYFGVKNKCCVVCARFVQQSNISGNSSFKTWNGSSSCIEAKIIVAGVDDISVYTKILEARLYDNLAAKEIEYRNRLLRIYWNKIRDIVTTSIGNATLHLDRKTLRTMIRAIGTNISRRGSAVITAKHRYSLGGTASDSSASLIGNLLNGPSYVFRKQCVCVKFNYFCNGFKEGEKHLILDVEKSGLYSKIKAAVEVLTDHSRRFTYNLGINLAEQFKSVLASFTLRKRVNNLLKSSFQLKYAPAAVRQNTGRKYCSLHKTIHQSSIDTYEKLYGTRSRRKIKKVRQRILSKSKARRSIDFMSVMDSKTFKYKVKQLMKLLNKTKEERDILEKSTRKQVDSPQWLEERRIRLTASNFGTICNKRATTSCESLLRRVMYSFPQTYAIIYGKENEKRALKDIEKTIGKPIKECGLFVDSELPYLAATPDGLIDDDGIVEVKCPFGGQHCTPEELIKIKKGYVTSLWNKLDNGSVIIKKKHNYHFQVQGQLHILNRNYCKFVMWTKHGMKIETIYKDDAFWRTEMVQKLSDFYKTCLLPEIIDPGRHSLKSEPF